jgi:hypothetical protein
MAMDIGEWLRRIGLQQYKAAFRDNEIDGEVLWSLTADDLKDVGVTPVGHRGKILTAIAGLSAHEGDSAPADNKHLASTVQTSRAAFQLPILERAKGQDPSSPWPSAANANKPARERLTLRASIAPPNGSIKPEPRFGD